ncbi:hypothetical protein FI667_g1398, partial [Globisporangium splendens]
MRKPEGAGGRMWLRLLLVATVGVACGLSGSSSRISSEPMNHVEVKITVHGDVASDHAHATVALPTSPSIAVSDGSDAEKTRQKEPVGDLSVVSPDDTARDQSDPTTQSLTKAALIKELEATELMVKLQQKKLELLEKIRSETLREESDVAIVVEPMMRNPRPNEYSDFIERKIETMTAAAVHELLRSSLRHVFQTLFVEKATMTTPSPVVDMKMMKLRATGIQDLLVVALEDGTIEFYLAPALLLLRFQVDSGRTVRLIDVELHGERQTLAII